jgi:hypothetical protein
MRQLELLTPAQLATMRDRTRRRNYSAAAEGFRDTHQRHRAWGLTQRHARKLSRLYGTTANASTELRRRADELAPPSAPTRTAEPTASETVTPEQVGSGPLLPDRGHDAARDCDPSRPSRPATTGPRPGQRRIRFGRPARQHPGRPGKQRGEATNRMRRPARCPRPETDPEPPEKSRTKTPGPGRQKECRPPAENTDPPDGSVPPKRLPRTGPAVISPATRRIRRSAPGIALSSAKAGVAATCRMP